MKMLRAATRQEFDPKASSHPLLDSEVMGISGKPPIHVFFFLERLRHWRRVIRFGSQQLRAYIWLVREEKNSWYSLLPESFDWLRNSCAKLSGAPCFSQDSKYWEELANHKYDPFPKYIHQALAAQSNYTARKVSVKGWHQAVNLNLHKAGWPTLSKDQLPLILGRDDNPRKSTNETCFSHICPICDCGKASPSRKSFMSHFYRKQRKKCPIRARIYSEVCPCCMVCFQSRENAIYHIAHASIRCRLYVLALLPRMDQELRVKLDAESASNRKVLTKSGYHPRAVWRPAHRIDGPRHPLAQGLIYMPKSECRAHLNEYEDMVIQWPDPQDVLPNATAPPSNTCETNLAGHLGWLGMAPHCTSHAGGKDEVAPDPFLFDSLPAKLKSRELVFVHIYSGLRRKGDLQHHLEWRGSSLGMTVIVISLDIAFDPVGGNLRDCKVLSTWWEHIVSRRIAAVPPVGMARGPRRAGAFPAWFLGLIFTGFSSLSLHAGFS